MSNIEVIRTDEMHPCARCGDLTLYSTKEKTYLCTYCRENLKKPKLPNNHGKCPTCGQETGNIKVHHAYYHEGKKDIPQ